MTLKALLVYAHVLAVDKTYADGCPLAAVFLARGFG